MAGLYIHIPFCKQACHYCDFHFSTNLDQNGQLIDALIRELSLRKDYLKGEHLETIYFGGGTPSLLKGAELKKIMEAIHNHCNVNGNAEITLEANPDDLHTQKFEELKSVGINRLSIGIQSFDDNVLTYFNRAHNKEDAIRSFAEARSAAFDNISIDLIYGVPGQTHQHWQHNIQLACGLGPEHISAYALTIEENTVFGRWQTKNKIKAVEEHLVAEQLEILMNDLVKEGYQHYEISNFSKPGFHSRHNSNYWNQVKYLGLGPSAHSYDGLSRQFNVPNNSVYIKSVSSGVVPFEREILTQENTINEYILTRIRTARGCDLNYLKTMYQYDLISSHRVYLEKLVERELAELKGNTLLLTNMGKLLADKIALDLFVNAL